MDFFSSLTDAIPTLTAAAFGAAIGAEREWRRHPGGLRSCVLVAASASAFTQIALAHAVGSQGAALGGIAQCVGFLGAGVIIHEGIQVRGLSTAANFWAVAAIGVANGTHEFAQALMLTLVVFSVHLILRPLSLWIDRKAPPGEDEPK